MATLIRYVNRSVTHTSGDGTTNGTGNGGTNSYNTLNDAEVALRQTLTGVTNDVNDELGNATISLDILCTGGQSDTTVVAFANASWVTDATHRIRVRLNGTGAGAKWDTGLYYLSAAHTYEVGTFSVGKLLHMTLQDLQVEATNTIDQAQHALKLGNFALDVHIVRGFYRTTGTTGTWDTTVAITSYSAGATGAYTLWMQNVTVVSADGRTFRLDGYSTTATQVNIFSCTFVNRASSRDVFNASQCDVGAVCRLKNLLIQGPGTTNYVSNGDHTTATILTQDTTAPGTGLDSKTVTFVDATNWDYHLASGDTSAKDAGTDLSADANYPFSTDGDAVTRTGTWDIGADEVVGGGGGGPVIIGQYRRRAV